jgi:hypothetical protein
MATNLIVSNNGNSRNRKDRLSSALYSLPGLREIVVPFKHNDARLYKAKTKPKHMASTQPEHRHP